MKRLVLMPPRIITSSVYNTRTKMDVLLGIKIVVLVVVVVVVVVVVLELLVCCLE